MFFGDLLGGAAQRGRDQCMAAPFFLINLSLGHRLSCVLLSAREIYDGLADTPRTARPRGLVGDGILEIIPGRSRGSCRAIILRGRPGAYAHNSSCVLASAGRCISAANLQVKIICETGKAVIGKCVWPC